MFLREEPALGARKELLQDLLSLRRVTTQLSINPSGTPRMKPLMPFIYRTWGTGFVIIRIFTY